LKTLTGF